MGIKDILLHLDDSAAAESRLELAILYASKHGAHLRGIYPVAHAFYESSSVTESSGQQRIEALFRGKTAAAGVSSEWLLLDSRVIGTTVSEIVTAQAYYSDLVVVGQTNYRNPSMNVPKDLPERLVLACGRPVLVVPYTGLFVTAADRVLVAWKTGRESVRSLQDAMPHIEKSHHASVVAISPESLPAEGDENQILQVKRYLAKHEVNAHSEQICSGSQSVGDTLLNVVCEQTADLLVMGAYAPTLRGSLALSIVAKHVLQHLTVPVLLSH